MRPAHHLGFEMPDVNIQFLIKPQRDDIKWVKLNIDKAKTEKGHKHSLYTFIDHKVIPDCVSTALV